MDVYADERLDQLVSERNRAEQTAAFLRGQLTRARLRADSAEKRARTAEHTNRRLRARITQLEEETEDAS